jgi:hypothetical protein
MRNIIIIRQYQVIWETNYVGGYKQPTAYYCIKMLFVILASYSTDKEVKYVKSAGEGHFSCLHPYVNLNLVQYGSSVNWQRT